MLHGIFNGHETERPFRFFLSLFLFQAHRHYFFFTCDQTLIQC